MIRVNLLRSLGMTESGGAGIITGGEIVSVDIKQQAAIKGLFILLFPIALIGWERVNISTLKAELNELQQKIQKVESEKAAFGDASPKVEKFTKEREKIEKEVEVIRELTSNRLREVKTLDQLQSLVPPATWLKRIAIRGNTVVLDGFTTAERGVPDFTFALENSPFFSDVRPGDTTRVETRGGPALRFTLNFKIGEGESEAERSSPRGLGTGGFQ